MEAVGVVISLITGVLEKYESIQSLNDEVRHFRRVLSAVRSVLQEIQRQFQRGLLRFTSLYRPLEMLKEGIREGSQVLEECSRKKKLRALVFSKTYLGKLSTAASRIKDSTSLIATAGVVVQGSLREKLDEANERIGKLKHQIDHHHHTVSELLKQQLIPEMQSLPDQVVTRLLDLGLVSGRQDCQAQLKEIAERADDLRKEKAFFEEQLLQQVQSLSLATTVPKKQSIHRVKEVPAELRCPLSLDVMEDPVVLVQSGNTYDRENLCRSLLLYPNLDPSTNVRFDQKMQFIENFTVRQTLIREFGDAAFRRYDDSGFQGDYNSAWERLHSDQTASPEPNLQPPNASPGKRPLSIDSTTYRVPATAPSSSSHRSVRPYMSNTSDQRRSVASELSKLEMQLGISNPGGNSKSKSISTTLSSEPVRPTTRSVRRNRRLNIPRRSRITVMAPAGKLGIILANKSDSRGTIVSGVRTSSVLADQITPGDRIVAIDGEDVSIMKVSEITTILARKENLERSLSVLTF